MNDVKSTGLSVLQEIFGANCFPEALDQRLRTLVEQKEVQFDALAAEVERCIGQSKPETWNRTYFILRTAMNNFPPGSENFNWAVYKLLQLLIFTRDPRLLEIQSLLAAFIDQNQELATSDRFRPELEKLERKLGALVRTKTSMYPRSRIQVNSTAFLRAAMNLRPEDCVPTQSDSSFFVLGTCFAENLHREMEQRGLAATIINHQEETAVDLIFSDLTERDQFVELIEPTSNPCVILTLGFAETTSLDKMTESEKSESLDKFRSPEFISECITTGARKLRNINSNVRIFVTVSPVPLEGTASSFNVFEANAVSKSIVRYAVALACRQDSAISYFPSYEIVTQIANSAGVCPFGEDDGHPRHVNEALVSVICSLFLDVYCPWLPAGEN